MDIETKKILSDAERLSELSKKEEWKLVKAIFTEKIFSLSDITSFDETEPTNLAVKIKANQEAIKILIDVLNEVEGKAQSDAHYKDQFKEINEDYIKSY